jgi:hypothetical protein
VFDSRADWARKKIKKIIAQVFPSTVTLTSLPLAASFPPKFSSIQLYYPIRHFNPRSLSQLQHQDPPQPIVSRQSECQRSPTPPSRVRGYLAFFPSTIEARTNPLHLFAFMLKTLCKTSMLSRTVFTPRQLAYADCKLHDLNLSEIVLHHGN